VTHTDKQINKCLNAVIGQLKELVEIDFENHPHWIKTPDGIWCNFVTHERIDPDDLQFNYAKGELPDKVWRLVTLELARRLAEAGERANAIYGVCDCAHSLYCGPITDPRQQLKITYLDVAKDHAEKIRQAAFQEIALAPRTVIGETQ